MPTPSMPTAEQVYLPTKEQWEKTQQRLAQLEYKMRMEDEILTVKDVERIYKCSRTAQWRKRDNDPKFKHFIDNGIKYRRVDMDKYFNKTN